MSLLGQSRPNQLARKSGNVRFAPSATKLAKRLLAYARLCRQIAGTSGSEEIERLAEECDRAAASEELVCAPAAKRH